MDARLVRAAVLAAALASLGASYRTQNFVVNAPTPQMAEQIGKQAETYRRDLAKLWLNQTLPNWQNPCPITAQVAESLGAGGATSFMFDGGEVFGWQMQIQGSLERILDSVLPHEVTHTIFASYFRRPLPRWADEGACTTVEHTSERTKQQQMMIRFLRTGHGIPFHSMFAMKEYPQDVLPLYAQGHSLVSYLVQQGGRQKFLNFVSTGLQAEQWPSATKQFYGYANLSELQNSWLDWVKKGSPRIDKPEPGPTPGDPVQLADASPPKRPAPDVIYRGQSGDKTDNVAGDLVPVSRPKPAAQLAPTNEIAMASNAPLPGPGSWSPSAERPATVEPVAYNPARMPHPIAPHRPGVVDRPLNPDRRVVPDRPAAVDRQIASPGGLQPPPAPLRQSAPAGANGGTRGASIYAIDNNQPVAAP